MYAENKSFSNNIGINDNDINDTSSFLYEFAIYNDLKIAEQS